MYLAEIIKFEINVTALSSLSYLMLDCRKAGNDVKSSLLMMRDKLVFKNLSQLEKSVWRESLLALQNEIGFEFYSSEIGGLDFCSGERSRLREVAIEDNPYPEEAYGFEMWLGGWREQDSRMKEDEAYANCNEYTEWLEDVKLGLE
ncbi:hypothetical protein [Pseudoalteromonas lipolytica]|uniref:hypothetical protein n=1 Tax=Pseudoalteromonas lipolytica TaxID=570156 RepID=UPI0030B646A9